MQRHLNDLMRALERHHWHIIATDEDVPGYSALWQIRRYQRSEWRYTLVFEGLEVDGILPPEQSYGCHLREAPAISFYFSKNNPRAWRERLAAFIEQLNALTIKHL